MIALKHQTKAQFVARLRERYRTAKAGELAVLATWLVNHLDAGDITIAEIRTAFGLTQANALITRARTLKDRAAGVAAAQGE